MWIELTNTTCTVRRYDEREHAWLHNFLTFSSTQFRPGQAVRTVETFLLNPLGMTFPSGVLPLLREAATSDGLAVDVLDRRVVPCVPDSTARLEYLRDYQESAVEHVWEKQRGIVHAPTGAGKTLIAVGLADLLPCRWLFLAHREILLRQFHETASKFLREPVGVWSSGTKQVEPRVVAAMLPTVYSALQREPEATRKLLAGFGGLGVDECHVLPAKTFQCAANACTGAYYRVGYSGTPLQRSDHRGLYAVGALGPVIYRIRAEELVTREVIARPIVRMLARPVIASYAPTYAEGYQELIVQDKARMAQLLGLVKSSAKPALVFVRDLDHGKAITDRLTRAGTRAEFVWGGRNARQRSRAVERVEYGDIDVLVANVVFQEGVNLPAIQTVILAGGGRSAIACLQCAGRGTRRRDEHGRETKTTFEVIDLSDRNCGCKGPRGYEHKACRWMDDHSAERRKAYLGEGYEVREERA